MAQIQNLRSDAYKANMIQMGDLVRNALNEYDRFNSQKIKNLKEEIRKLKDPLELRIQDMKAEVVGMERQNHHFLNLNR